MGKSQRVKGHSFERFVANELKSTGLFPEAERQLEFQASQAIGIDLRNTGNLKIQCKAYRQYAPITKIEEVIFKDKDIPCLVTKGDRKRPVIVFYFDDFLEILKGNKKFKED